MARHLSVAQVELPAHFANIPESYLSSTFDDTSQTSEIYFDLDQDISKDEVLGVTYLAGGVKFLLVCKEGVCTIWGTTSATAGCVSATASRLPPAVLSAVLIRNGRRDKRPQRVLARDENWSSVSSPCTSTSSSSSSSSCPSSKKPNSRTRSSLSPSSLFIPRSTFFSSTTLGAPFRGLPRARTLAPPLARLLGVTKWILLRD